MKWMASALFKKIWMKGNCNQTKLIESNESQVHSRKANWFKIKSNCIQTKLRYSNKAYWIKWKPSTFKQS